MTDMHRNRTLTDALVFPHILQELILCSDIVLQNDIAETVRENRNDLAVLEEKFPDTDILVFDREGFCIYPEGESLTLPANSFILQNGFKMFLPIYR